MQIPAYALRLPGEEEAATQYGEIEK